MWWVRCVYSGFCVCVHVYVIVWVLVVSSRVCFVQFCAHHKLQGAVWVYLWKLNGYTYAQSPLLSLNHPAPTALSYSSPLTYPPLFNKVHPLCLSSPLGKMTIMTSSSSAPYGQPDCEPWKNGSALRSPWFAGRGSFSGHGGASCRTVCQPPS